MVRQLLLPLLGLGLLLSAETAAAQTQSAASNSPASAAKTARLTRRAGRTLTARERRQAEATAKAAAQSPVVAMATPAQPGWSGWSNEPVDLGPDAVLYHPRTNLSVAPGMPVNQIGHGVTTDYDGHPLRRPSTTNSTLPTPR
ncbi:MAG: hypothetical protein EOO59_10905 [Hymenobacter sp.]|nr:MAG: hypothetical protein EOO59_10905 [Hymenobacter sp.]